MHIEEAVYYLMTCSREEIQDTNLNIIGCRWTRDGKAVAHGRFGSDSAVVSVSIDGTTQAFGSEDARRLRPLGVLGASTTGRLFPESLSLVEPAARVNDEKSADPT